MKDLARSVLAVESFVNILKFRFHFYVDAYVIQRRLNVVTSTLYVRQKFGLSTLSQVGSDPEEELSLQQFLCSFKVESPVSTRGKTNSRFTQSDLKSCRGAKASQ